MNKFILAISLLLSFNALAVESKDLQCLTDTIYFESRGEPIVGQVMVGTSVINRMRDDRWPNTICEVVYQKSQYSWTQEKVKNVGDILLYTQIQDMAFLLLSQIDYAEPIGITHYLRCDYREKVSWWQSMSFVGQIGEHCFYIDKQPSIR